MAGEVSQEMPLMIEDGWTIKATIKAIQKLHPSLTFFYRPMSWIERRKLAREQEALNEKPDEQDLLRAKHMASRILSWDQPTKPTPEAIMQLPTAVYLRLEAIIYGVDVADEVEIERKN